MVVIPQRIKSTAWSYTKSWFEYQRASIGRKNTGEGNKKEKWAKRAFQIIWDIVPTNLTEKLVLSMNKKLEAVIVAKGHHTKN